MAKKKPASATNPPQTVFRLNDAQREALMKLAEAEDKSITDTIKEALKLLAAKHKIDWPRNRG